MNLLSKVSVPAQVLARQIDDETVILDLGSGTYFGLDAVGSRIWQLMTDGETLGAICDAMVAAYDVSRSDVERDVLELAQSLLERKLIDVS
jgi:hypothetical protein